MLGAIFSIILTRTLSQQEYGTWGLISGLIGYVMIINLIISFWSTRETARKIESGKTAVFGNMILSIVAVIVYVFTSIFISNQAQINLDVILFSSILIPMMFLHGILVAIHFGWKPNVISYATLFFGISQVSFGILFVYYLDLRIYGIIFTNLFAYAISIIILLKYAKYHLKNQIKLIFLKSWFRLSWIPLYPGLSILIDTLGIIIFSTITGSVLGIAIWAAANILPGIIRNVKLISFGVYPKLLEGGDKKYLDDNISHLFYFNFLMLGIVIAFAKPALFALNPIYQGAYFVVIILAIRSFFFVLTDVFINILSGNETIDTEINPTFKQYIKSKIFYPHTLKLIQTSLFLSILSIGIIILIQNKFETMVLLNFWAIILLVSQIPITVYLYVLTKKTLNFTFNYRSILKYFISFIISFLIIYILTEIFLIYNENIFLFIPQVFQFMLLAVLFYFALTYVLDYKTRELFNSVIKEIKEKLL